jgi:hypothetical protein
MDLAAYDVEDDRVDQTPRRLAQFATLVSHIVDSAAIRG